MTEKKLREKIAEYICGSDSSDPMHKFDISNAGAQVDHILALVKEAGWVKLDPDQSLPDPIHNQYLGDIVVMGLEDMQKNWRKVKIE